MTASDGAVIRLSVVSDINHIFGLLILFSDLPSLFASQSYAAENHEDYCENYFHITDSDAAD